MNLLEVENLHVRFPVRRNGRRLVARAVEGVDLTIARAETLGLVGESGSGKTTTGRAILRLVDVNEGTIRFNNQVVTDFGRRTPLAYHKQVQVVFQDPYSSLNPRMRVGDAVAAPARRHLALSKSEALDRARDLFDLVGLDRRHVTRYPHEFSGGQRQRIAIARAVASEPDLIVCDEAVSALDVSTQAQVLNLLTNLRNEMGVAYLFIAHDLDVVRHMSDRIAVMYLGRIVETGPAHSVADQPRHPYTELLHAASPVPHPTVQESRRLQRRALRTTTDPPSPLNPPSGCGFHTRCPFVMDVCRHEVPPATAIPGTDGGLVRCHLHTHGPTLQGAPIGEFVALSRERATV